MLTVVAHFIDGDMKFQATLLALKKISETHSDENETAIILNVFDDYEIRNKLDYFVDDNANINDIMLRAISNTFRIKHEMNYDSIEHRLRCLNHVINLSVQAYFLSKHSETERQIVEISTTRKLTEDFQEYRKLKFQERLHNIIKFIFVNFQRIQRFKKFSEELLFKRDHVVR